VCLHKYNQFCWKLNNFENFLKFFPGVSLLFKKKKKKYADVSFLFVLKDKPLRQIFF